MVDRFCCWEISLFETPLLGNEWADHYTAVLLLTNGSASDWWSTMEVAKKLKEKEDASLGGSGEGGTFGRCDVEFFR